MNFGRRGKELLTELKQSDWLPLYSEDAVHRCILENKGHWAEMSQILTTAEEDEISQEFVISLTVHMQNILRNKRCLLAYMQHRLDRIRDLRWETGAVIPSNLQKKLSATEVQFFSQYNRLLSNYMLHYPALDLTEAKQPPKDSKIEVRVLNDCGEIMTAEGPVTLEKGVNVYIRRADVESLVRQGILQHLCDI